MTIARQSITISDSYHSGTHERRMVSIAAAPWDQRAVIPPQQRPETDPRRGIVQHNRPEAEQ